MNQFIVITVKNKYFIRSRISEGKFRRVIRLFSSDLTASQIAFLTGINRTTINNILKKTRERMTEVCENESIFDSGEVEMDESYFQTCHISGLRGRVARGKTIFLGLKKRERNVYTQIIKNCSKEVILPMIKAKDTTLFMDSFKTYDGLVDLACKKYYRIYHRKNGSSQKTNQVKNHISSIENFWAITKVRFHKFRGMNKNTFYLHLKECEFRFNNRKKDIYQMLLKNLKNQPLKSS